MRHSIRSRIIWLFTLAMIAAASGTFLLVMMISRMVLQRTLRSYLVSAVEASTDDLVFENGSISEAELKDHPHDIFLEYKNGYLQIDEDFLDTMHNVESALYGEDGAMLYGKNPLAGTEEDMPFEGTRVYRAGTGSSSCYIYDRRLEVDGTDDLWIRGVVLLTEESGQIRDIAMGTIVFLPLLFLAAVMLGYLASRGILRPIRNMERSASEITSGTDLKKRLELGKGKDEVYVLGRTMNSMLDRLEDSFEAERRFASDASHELRTPVAVILAQSELALEKERSADEYRSALEVIRRQGGRMQTLVGDMLDYTRLEQRIDRYPMEELDLSALILTVCEEMRLIGYKHIDLTWDIVPDIHMQGNVSLLTRMTQNLIDNAYRYGKENGHIKVSLHRTSPKEKDAELTVSDDGCGIAPEDLEHIFERFYRGDRSRSGVKGNGLGLSMVKKIAEIHGAEVTVKSVPGKGSTFSVLIFL